MNPACSDEMWVESYHMGSAITDMNASVVLVQRSEFYFSLRF